jgi:hypothetical protein
MFLMTLFLGVANVVNILNQTNLNKLIFKQIVINFIFTLNTLNITLFLAK